MFSSFNEVEVDDNMAGNYNGVNYKIAEVELIDVQCTGRTSERLKIFKGVVICFSANKKVESEVLVFPKRDFNILGFRRTNWFSMLVLGIAAFFLFAVCIKSFILLMYQFAFFILLLALIPLSFILVNVIRFYNNQRKIKSIKIEDVSFSKNYKVYSDDQIDARYMLTPSFIERFKNLKTAFGDKNIKCSFYEDKVIFAIPSKRDLFELGSLYTPLDENNKYIKIFYAELKSIQDMIDYFKFNQNTGL